MPDFLFVFGYQSPDEWRTNRAQGTDFESSNAVWIAAPNGEAALRAGSSYAERYVVSLSQAGHRASTELVRLGLRPLDRAPALATVLRDSLGHVRPHRGLGLVRP